MTWSKLALKYHSQIWHLKLSTVISLLFLVTSNYTQRSLCTLCHWKVPLTLICFNPSQPVCISCGGPAAQDWLKLHSYTLTVTPSCLPCTPPAPQLWWAWGLEPRTGYSYTVTHPAYLPRRARDAWKALQSNTQQCCSMSDMSNSYPYFPAPKLDLDLV